MNFVLCDCPKKQDYFCKNWDGKGSAAERTSEVLTECESKQVSTCEFFAKPIIRKDCDWLYSTIAGSIPVEAEKEVMSIPIIESPVAVKEKPVKVKKQICSDCKEIATHLVEGYRPIYLCDIHTKEAESHGVATKQLEK